jgi:alkylated DNA repair dioxygenase AlkB
MKRKITYLDENEESWIEEYGTLPSHLLTPTTLDDLWSLCPNERGVIKMFGKRHPTPRYQQTFSNDIKHYRFSGVDHIARPIPSDDTILKPYMDYANSLNPDMKFNMCFMNFYEDGSDYIGPHSDDEKQLFKGKNDRVSILSISIGAERKFVLHPKKKKKKTTTKKKNEKKSKEIENERFKKEFVLTNGSVILMDGKCQSTHKHSIPKIQNKKDAKKVGKRVNITFRLFKENK